MDSHIQFPNQPLLPPSGQDVELSVFVDANWAGCRTTRRSTSCWEILFLDCLSHNWARTQSVVALRSAEADFYAIQSGLAEAIQVQQL